MARWLNALISGILHLDEQSSILYGDSKKNVFKKTDRGNTFGDKSTDTVLEAKTLTLDSDKAVLNSSLYGTANPSETGAVEGQIYFKIIS